LPNAAQDTNHHFPAFQCGTAAWIKVNAPHLVTTPARRQRQNIQSPEFNLPQYELLVGSGAFWERAQVDIQAARSRVLVQAMTFEGDAAGLSVAATIQSSTAADRRVLVDDYSRHVINDSFLALSRDPALQAEARATWAMFDAIQASGAGLRITNPVARNPLLYPLRNHKKLLVMDDAVWIGGINFSDHNFAWHDMMLRIESRQVADWLAAAFDRDWHGLPNGAVQDFTRDLQIASMDGGNNAEASIPLLRLFSEAKCSIEVVSAYPTFPFVDAMAVAAKRGVPVTIYTPRDNNKPIIRDYLIGIAQKSGVRIALLPDMTHVKAALIDGKVLVLGSSNFDFVSYRANAEYIATIRDPGLIADFTRRLLGPAQAVSVNADPGDYPAWRCRASAIGLKAADRLLSGLKPGQRIGEWSNPQRRA
jgi:cardiolipin synthase